MSNLAFELDKAFKAPEIFNIIKSENLSGQCQYTKKKDRIKFLVETLPVSKLREILSKKGHPPQEKQTMQAKSSPKASLDIEKKFQSITNQIAHLLSRIENLETKFARFSSSNPIYDDSKIFKIKKIILNLMRPGDSLLLDEIRNHRKLRDYPWSLIEKTIRQLIHEAELDATEGASMVKIDSTIGCVIRR